MSRNINNTFSLIGVPPVNIIDSGYVSLDSDWHTESTRSSYALLYFIEAGSGTLVESGREYVMVPGYVYFVPSKARLSYFCTDKLRKLYLHVNMIGSDGFDVFQNLHGICALKLADNEIGELISLYKKNGISDSISFRGMVYQIMGRIISMYPEDGLVCPLYSPMVRDAMEYIQNNLSISLTLAQVADSIYASQNTLRKRFKSEVNMTIGQYIDDLVFYRAEFLLTKTDCSIREISELLGFCDQFYFSRRFSVRYGRAPLQYRKLSKQYKEDKS